MRPWVLISIVGLFGMLSTQPCIASNNWNMNLKDRLGVVPVDGGFRQEGYWVWGSSIIKWDDGTEGEMGQLERVQGVVEDGELKYLSFAVMDGPGGFGNGKNTWNIVVPIKPE